MMIMFIKSSCVTVRLYNRESRPRDGEVLIFAWTMFRKGEFSSEVVR